MSICPCSWWQTAVACSRSQRGHIITTNKQVMICYNNKYYIVGPISSPYKIWTQIRNLVLSTNDKLRNGRQCRRKGKWEVGNRRKKKKHLISETTVSQMLKSFNTAERHVRSSSVCTLWGHFKNAANLYNETDISMMKIDCGLTRCNTAQSCR